jgi:Tfp pilus assembly protein FimT
MEVITCLLIAGILFAFVLPVSQSFYQKNQVQVLTDDLINAVGFARNKALQEGAVLILRPLLNTGDWSSGMLLFKDNKTHQFSAEDSPLFQWRWPYKGLKISWVGFQSSRYLLFYPEFAHAASSGHFVIESVYSKPVKLVVNRFGRVNHLV